jgi:hypothetical protein
MRYGSGAGLAEAAVKVLMFPGDGWYPIFTLETDLDDLGIKGYYEADAVEIPDEVYERYVKVMVEFKALHEELRRHYLACGGEV